MKSIPTALALAVLAAGCASDTTVRRDAPREPAEFDMEAMMAEMMRLGTPGEEHAGLAQSVGSWDVEGRWWSPGSAEGQPMVASAERKTILNGRLVQETFRTDWGGMPFEGMLLQGYDNLKGEYWSAWYDNMSTWGGHSTGNYNAEGQLVLEGVMHDAMSPEGRLVRTVVTEHGDDNITMQMFDVSADGDAQISMELHYKRAN